MAQEKPATSGKSGLVGHAVRIWGLRIVGLLCLPFMIMITPLWGEGPLRDLMRLAGTLLVIAGVLGRFWSTLYVGDRKKKLVMQDGPYSICRHPLYFSSTLGVAGFGLLLGSVLLALVLTGAVYAILYVTAGREEGYLRAKFGGDYDAYAARVPRVWPKPSLFSTPGRVDVVIEPLYTVWRDAVVFLSFLPLAMIVDWVRVWGILPGVTLP